MEGNCKTETSSIDPQSTTTPHLILESSPQSRSSISSTHSSSELNMNWAPAKSLADSPARSSVSSGHATFDHGSIPREEKTPTTPQGRDQMLENVEGTAKMNPDSKYGGGGGSGSGQRTRPSPMILSREKREKMVKRVELGCRIIGGLFSLVSFSVMAADTNMGWALDSFYRYKEFRYSMSVNVIGFVYSAAQSSDLGYQLATGKPVFQHPLRYYFDFALDQVITYLLISASSSAATRTEDWQSNWGKDKFPGGLEMSHGGRWEDANWRLLYQQNFD